MEKPDNGGLMSIISKLVDNTDQVWKYLVCPFKLNYGLESLGPPTQMWENTTYDKIDGSIKNSRGNSLEYSFYQARGISHEKSFTVIYLHSHGACRVEGYHLLKVCGIYSVSVCLFDFAGCGHSEGEFISMGIYEKDDTCLLMEHIKQQFGVRQFTVWGRSMGAATGLQAYPMLRDTFALVLDSPFTTVRSVYRNAVKQRLSLPDMIIDMVFAYASSEIVNHYGFDVSSIKPYDAGPQIDIPTVLIGTREDQITDFRDLLELYDILKISEHDKVIVECKGKHNDDRDHRTLKNTVEFLANVRGMKPIRSGGYLAASPVFSRPPSAEIGLRKDSTRSIDPRIRSNTDTSFNQNRGLDALKRLTAFGGVSVNTNRPAHITEENTEQGIPQDFNRKTVMDYTYRGLNTTDNHQERSKRDSYNKRLRNNRSVNTARNNASLGLFMDKPAIWNTNNQEINTNRSRPSTTTNLMPYSGPSLLKPSSSQQYSVGNLYNQPNLDNSGINASIVEKRQNILGFLDQKMKENAMQGDSSQIIPLSPSVNQNDSYRQDQHQSNTTNYKPMLGNQPLNKNTYLANQGLAIAVNLKSAYRPFTLGPRKPQDQGGLIRNAKSFKHYSDDLLQNQTEQQEIIPPKSVNSSPIPQHILEPNFHFNPLYSTYGNSNSKVLNAQPYPQQNQPQPEKRPFQGSFLSPLDFAFINQRGISQQQIPQQAYNFSQRQSNNHGTYSHQSQAQNDINMSQDGQNFNTTQGLNSQQNHNFNN